MKKKRRTHIHLPAMVVCFTRTCAIVAWIVGHRAIAFKISWN